MLKRSLALLGRWKSTDHFKGRGKNGGSIHVRHTHGSNGRYHRLADRFTLRDGRRHLMNRMKGGLGLKLGGGLFGTRVPRQTSLSKMSKDDLEVEVHGHPNITNPYRDCLEEHPNLDGVIQNPSLRVTFLVALPRIPLPGGNVRGLVRVDRGGNVSGGSGSPTRLGDTFVMPRRWAMAVEQLTTLATSLESLYAQQANEGLSSGGAFESLERVQLIIATGHSSVSLLFDPSTSEPSQAKETIIGGLALLFQDWEKGVKVGDASRSKGEAVADVRVVEIDGKMMTMNASLLPRKQKLFMATTTSGTRNVYDVPLSSTSQEDGEDVELNVEQVGLEGWLTRLDEDATALGGSLRLRTSLVTGTAAQRQRFTQIDSDMKRCETTTASLMQWYFYNKDPRSHFMDTLGHGGRLLSTHVLVECRSPVSVRKSVDPALAALGGAWEEGRGEASTLGGDTVDEIVFKGPIHSDKLLLRSIERQEYHAVRDMPTAVVDCLKRWSLKGSLLGRGPSGDSKSTGSKDGAPTAHVDSCGH